MLRNGDSKRTSFGNQLHGHCSLDVRMRIVVLDREIFIAKREYVLHRWIQTQRRQMSWRARQLKPRLLEVIEIQMRIAERVDEVARLVAGHLGHHHRKQRVGGNVERHPKKNIGGALIELARELSVGDVKLKKAMARR